MSNAPVQVQFSSLIDSFESVNSVSVDGTQVLITGSESEEVKLTCSYGTYKSTYPNKADCFKPVATPLFKDGRLYLPSAIVEVLSVGFFSELAKSFEESDYRNRDHYQRKQQIYLRRLVDLGETLEVCGFNYSLDVAAWYGSSSNDLHLRGYDDFLWHYCQQGGSHYDPASKKIIPVGIVRDSVL